MFSRDLKDFACRTPRTLQSSKFGPYAVVYIPSRRTRVMRVIWAITYGVAIALVWYAILLVRVS